jgi:hypothetical protein
MRRHLVVLPIAVCLALPAAAQQQAAAPAPAAPIGILPTAEQIAGAVMALPQDMRADATVLGYAAVGKPMVKLREGTNDMICLPSEPPGTRFHSACYHKGMEPFMARGRELRLDGVKDPQVDTVRFAEVASGKIKMPSGPSMLYQIFGGTFDPITSTISGGNALYVTYIPFATPASTGLSAKPTDKGPWIMFPGTPKAHIMNAGKM